MSRHRPGNHANHDATKQSAATLAVRPVRADLEHVPPTQAQWERAILRRLDAKLRDLIAAQNLANPDSSDCDTLLNLKE